MMPLNAKMTLEHRLGNWSSSFDLQAVDAKNDLQAVRMELHTPGYALAYLRTSYQRKIAEPLSLRFERASTISPAGTTRCLWAALLWANNDGHANRGHPCPAWAGTSMAASRSNSDGAEFDRYGRHSAARRPALKSRIGSWPQGKSMNRPHGFSSYTQPRSMATDRSTHLETILAAKRASVAAAKARVSAAELEHRAQRTSRAALRRLCDGRRRQARR